MAPTGDGWTEVRHRKKPANRRNGDDITTYFVSNIPNGATKDEFRRIFKPFGTISDIYFAVRKGKNGKNFGFIRFAGVKDKKLMEANMNGMLCKNNKLEINIARHERPGQMPPIRDMRKGGNLHDPIPINVRGGFTSSRSYAEVVGAGTKGNIPPQEMSPKHAHIRLVTDERMVRWINGHMLIREVKSLDHLGHLSVLLSTHSDMGMKVKYAGGMKAILEFGSSVMAKDFLKNDSNWKNIFNYIRMGEETDYRFERVANEKKKINEEIRVEAGGKTFDVGVVEYEDKPWFPFRFNNIEQPYEYYSDANADHESEVADSDKDEEMVNSEDEEGISDTWIDDIEDGKIVGDGNKKIDSRNRGGAGDVTSSGVQKTVTDSSQASPAILETQQPGVHSNEEVAAPLLDETVIINDKKTCDKKINEYGQVTADSNKPVDCNMEQTSLGLPRPTSFPPRLAQSGCFGPFPYTRSTPSPNDQASQLQGSINDRSSRKNGVLKLSLRQDIHRYQSKPSSLVERRILQSYRLSDLMWSRHLPPNHQILTICRKSVKLK
ncbi:unnamed protein product [Lactuca virosa]|uniref:RRM domain-containing protein n=1 Tax=Lactuca virosa TaxID=75947 RepID=A0AAU9PNR6_9ASTR|nr:unnamed protein product [Lactuca virosa]